MSGPRFSLVEVMDHEVHVTEWGKAGNPGLMMWHGLARTGRDFDELAAAFSDQFFVICPDTIGRGLSSWSRDPVREYTLDYNTGIATDLMDHYGLDTVGWIGTSMGGLIGMRLASGPTAERLEWLIVNDIGPEIPAEAVTRILQYVAQPVEFQSVSEAETWLRNVYAPLGDASDVFWRRMARTSVRRLEDGGFAPHYDPAIMALFSPNTRELDSWDRFGRITLPMHVVAGALSDILTPEILARMQAEKPNMGSTVFPTFGHAPSLSRDEDGERMREIVAGLQALAQP